MGQRHQTVLAAIRREHGDVIAALRNASRSKKRGTPGDPGYDPRRLEAAIATADDAYALLLIATAEGFLRQYLETAAIDVGAEPRLSMMIDKSAKELNQRLGWKRLRPNDRTAMHDLRECRNNYAHGHGTGVFPSVPSVQEVLSRFLDPFPDF